MTSLGHTRNPAAVRPFMVESAAHKLRDIILSLIKRSGMLSVRPQLGAAEDTDRFGVVVPGKPYQYLVTKRTDIDDGDPMLLLVTGNYDSLVYVVDMFVASGEAYKPDIPF